MSHPSKEKGTRAETAVVRFLRDNGFPGADRQVLRGSADGGDVLITAGMIAEVKTGARASAGTPGQVGKWLAETERERRNAGADIGLLILHPRGRPPAHWHVWTTTLQLQLAAGLGVTDGMDDSEPVMLWLSTWCTIARRSWGDPA